MRDTYGTLQEPDCEHLCIAILALEGVLGNAVSANWDGLIEAAVAQLAGHPDHVMRVVVLPEEAAGTQPALQAP